MNDIKNIICQKNKSLFKNLQIVVEYFMMYRSKHFEVQLYAFIVYTTSRIAYFEYVDPLNAMTLVYTAYYYMP